MSDRGNIAHSIQRLADTLGQDPDVDAVYLFGSRALSRTSALSDIDIGILLGEQVPPQEYFDRRLRYVGECCDMLHTDRVDVVILNDAPPLLAYEVVAPRKILVERNREHRVAFEVDRINRYLDFKPVLDLQVKYVKQQLEQGKYFD
jgi:predicted nucleotidyltransferase